jgi:ATP-binding cassette subfamily C (CFTR/MRP) protein 10
MQHGKITHQGIPTEILTKETVMSQVSREDDDADEHSDSDSESDERYANINKEDGGLVTVEEKDEGAVKLHVYWSYWLAIGHCLATSILVSLLLMQGRYSRFFFRLVQHSYNVGC